MNNLFDELDSNEEKEDKLEKTMEIEVLDLNFGAVSKEIDNVYNNKKSKKRKSFLPINIYEEHVIQKTFVNCSVLGFIALFFSYGEIIYILTHI